MTERMFTEKRLTKPRGVPSPTLRTTSLGHKVITRQGWVLAETPQYNTHQDTWVSIRAATNDYFHY